MNSEIALVEPLLSQEQQEQVENEVCQVENEVYQELPSHETTTTYDEEESIENPWKNRNVRLTLLLGIVSGTADSIWGSGVVLSGFLLALAKAMNKSSEQNTLVGAAEAVQGLTQLIFALPTGVLADVVGKAKVVKAGGGLMLVTIAVTLWALMTVKEEEDGTVDSSSTFEPYFIMVAALSLWGIVGGISSGPAQALYADSITKGSRSEMLTWLYSCYLISSAAGPVVNIVLFLTVSSNTEDWSLNEIFPVFFTGILLEIPAAILMFFYSEKYVISEEEEEEGSSETIIAQEQRDEDNSATAPFIRNPLQMSENNEELEDNGAIEASVTTVQQVTTTASSRCQSKFRLTRDAIPYVLFLSSLIVSLGSGASVKYFPLYFKELGLSSVAVQAIFLVVPISISAFSFVAQRVSKKMGRIETTVAFDIIGTSLLYYMTWLSQQSMTTATSSSLWKENPHRVILIVGVYLLRTGIMNSSYPLLESILMDSVPSNRRARWKSLESIAAFGWTGSALVGGILSDEHSYAFTFAITASVQLTGALILLLIQPVVEAEGDRPIVTSGDHGESRDENEEDNTCVSQGNGP